MKNIDFIESWYKTISKVIKLAKNAGFCYGVKMAVDKTIKIKEQNPNTSVCVLGELIHNSHVISKLEQLGIKTISSLEENSSGICIIRSHGESEDVFKKVKDCGYELVDLTCFDVKKVQSKAMELAQDGFFVIILGKVEHPEVVAISTNAKNHAKNKENIFVANSISSLVENEEKIKNAKKVGLVLQTTQTKEFLFEVVDYLSKIAKVLKIENTICPSTALRQQEAKKLAQVSDLMVVVGSKKSANTTHLAELVSKITKTIHIEKEDELEQYVDLIKSAQNIGITAGASTPDDIINAVIERLKKY